MKQLLPHVAWKTWGQGPVFPLQLSMVGGTLSLRRGLLSLGKSVGLRLHGRVSSAASERSNVHYPQGLLWDASRSTGLATPLVQAVTPPWDCGVLLDTTPVQNSGGSGLTVCKDCVWVTGRRSYLGRARQGRF